METNIRHTSDRLLLLLPLLLLLLLLLLLPLTLPLTMTQRWDPGRRGRRRKVWKWPAPDQAGTSENWGEGRGSMQRAVFCFHYCRVGRRIVHHPSRIVGRVCTDLWRLVQTRHCACVFRPLSLGVQNALSFSTAVYNMLADLFEPSDAEFTGVDIPSDWWLISACVWLFSTHSIVSINTSFSFFHLTPLLTAYISIITL